MERIRRTRTVEVVGRVRRSPRPTSSAGATVTATIQVSAIVTEGSVSEEQLAAWLADAISRYHLWRCGWVGIGMTGRLKVPDVEQI